MRGVYINRDVNGRELIITGASRHENLCMAHRHTCVSFGQGEARGMEEKRLKD